MYYGILEAIAAVGVAIAGFSGVVFVLGDRADRRLTAEEKNGLFHLLYTSLGPVIISLVLHALLSSSVNEVGVWRTGLIYLLWVSMMNFASLLVPKFDE